MATKSTNPNQDEYDGEDTGEDTEYDNPGIQGQIQYPEVEVDAERAAAFAGGKEDHLYPEDDPRNQGWTNPADRSSEVQEEDDEHHDENHREQ